MGDIPRCTDNSRFVKYSSNAKDAIVLIQMVQHTVMIVALLLFFAINNKHNPSRKKQKAVSMASGRGGNFFVFTTSYLSKKP